MGSDIAFVVFATPSTGECPMPAGECLCHATRDSQPASMLCQPHCVWQSWKGANTQESADLSTQPCSQEQQPSAARSSSQEPTSSQGTQPRDAAKSRSLEAIKRQPYWGRRMPAAKSKVRNPVYFPPTPSGSLERAAWSQR
ncbi:hypothetical protein V8C86DRAFT_2432168 [Haematococcus lacustris]